MPFVQSLASIYSNNDVDITTEAGGSGFGIEQVAKSYANIGDASKNPYDAVRNDFQNQ
jgi:ABC-type phosphate transport system substrate-binding protein